MGLGEALAKSIYDSVIRSPHQPPFGERGGPYVLVALTIAAAGVITALFNPVALSTALAYPLSRLQRARVLFRGGLVDAAIFLLVLSPSLLLVGHTAGWLVGYELRFDFMPFFFRALMVTLIVMPTAYWGRLRLQEARQRRSGNTLVAVILGIAGYMLVVGLLSFISSRLFASAAVELAALTIALVISQLIYRNRLKSYCLTADLVG
jgi:hypothetical protein